MGNDVAKAKSACAAAKGIYKTLGDAEGQAACMTTEMYVLIDEDKYKDAVDLGKDKITLLGDAGDRQGQADAYLMLSNILLDNKDFKAAEMTAQGALGMMMELRNKEGAT